LDITYDLNEEQEFSARSIIMQSDNITKRMEEVASTLLNPSPSGETDDKP